MKAWAASSQGWDGQSPPQTSPQCDTGRCSLVPCPDCTMAGGGGAGGGIPMAWNHPSLPPHSQRFPTPEPRLASQSH